MPYLEHAGGTVVVFEPDPDGWGCAGWPDGLLGCVVDVVGT